MVTLKMAVNAQPKSQPFNYPSIRYRFQQLIGTVWTDVQTRYRKIGTTDSYIVPGGTSATFRVGAALAFPPPDPTPVADEVFSNQVNVNSLVTPAVITLSGLVT